MPKPTPIFHGSVEKAELKFINPQRFNEYLYTLNGKNVEVTVAEKIKKRTTKANRYYWAYLRILEETGDDSNSLHEIFKKMFIPPTFKYIKVLDKEMKIPPTTTKLSSAEFHEYILKIEKVTGILAPDPDEFI